MSEQSSQLDAFSDLYICPYCNNFDKGFYCSSCGKPLTIEFTEIENQLVKRYKMFGFTELNESIAANTQMGSNYPLHLFNDGNGSVLMKIYPANNGQKIELIIIAYDHKVEKKYFQHLANKFWSGAVDFIAGNNSLPRSKRSGSSGFYIEKLAIKGILIKKQDSSKNDPDRWVSVSSTVTKTKSVAGNLIKFLFAPNLIKSSFNFRMDLEVAVLSQLSGKLYAASNRLYDIIRHQAEVVALQSAGRQTEAIHSPNAFLETVNAVIEGFKDYFKILIQYFKNPQYFAEVIAARNVITPGKIFGLYLVGLTCSITLPWLLSGGYLNSDNLNLFKTLPPFIGDLAELSAELFRTFLICIILHAVIRLSGRKGSFVSLLLCYLFFQSFVQIIERPFRYLLGTPLLSLFKNPAVYSNVRQSLFLLLGALYGYFLLPVFLAVYRARKGVVALAYLTVLIFFSFWQGFIIGYAEVTNRRKFGEEITHNKLVIFFRDGVTLKEATRLRDFLVKDGFEQPREQDLQVLKRDTTYIVNAQLAPGFIMDSSMRETFHRFATTLSSEVFNNAPVILQTTDKNFVKIDSFLMKPKTVWKTYQNQEYTIRYPSNWHFEEGGKMGTKFFLYCTGLPLGVVLITEDITRDIDLDKYIKLGMIQIKEQYKSFRLLDSSRQINNSRTYGKLIYTAEVKDEETRVEQYIWILNNKAYILSTSIALDQLDVNSIELTESILNTFIIN